MSNGSDGSSIGSQAVAIPNGAGNVVIDPNALVLALPQHQQIALLLLLQAALPAPVNAPVHIEPLYNVELRGRYGPAFAVHETYTLWNGSYGPYRQGLLVKEAARDANGLNEFAETEIRMHGILSKSHPE